MIHEQYLYTLKSGHACIEHFVNGWGPALRKRPGDSIVDPYDGELTTVTQSRSLTGAEYDTLVATFPDLLELHPDGLQRGWQPAHPAPADPAESERTRRLVEQILDTVDPQRILH